MWKRLPTLREEAEAAVNSGGTEGVPSAVEPVGAPAAAPEPESKQDDFWKDMIDFDDSAAVESESAAEPEPSPEPKGESPTPPAVEPPKVEAQPPAVEPPKAPEPAQTPEPPAAPPPSAPPVDYAALRAEEFQRLEKAYALPAEQATALLTEPETVLPKLAAKLHQDVMANVLAAVQSMLPQAVTQITDTKVRESEARNEFFGVWPQLRGYEQQVLAAGAMFRQINPTATKEQAVQAIGQLAMQALGLQQAPTQPAAPAPAPAPQVQPFQPAGSRSGTPPPAPKPTVWDDMLQMDYHA